MFLDYTKPTDHARVVKVLAFIKEEEHEKEKIVRDIAAKYPNLIECARQPIVLKY